MTDSLVHDDGDSPAAPAESADWPLRPWLLAALLGLAGLLIHLFTHEKDDVPWRAAVAAFLFFGSVGAAFTLDRRKWQEPAIFALAVGLVMAGLVWRAVSYGAYLPDEEYGLASGVVATALALPLFQADFLRRRFATPYRDIYQHIWTDAICAAGSLAFTGLAWVALAILSELFHLLKIDVLRDLMKASWFGWTYSGLAFGAALGTLRNQLKVLGTLQTVVLLVLSLLAVPLAAGLVLFLLATAVSGPQVLWEATRSATPILLTCAAGAFVLTSTIVRQDDAAMTRSRVMRIAALALAVVILPLAVFAAVSLGLRLNQYGLAPERLWGLVAIVVACAWGVGYWGALARGRKAGWAQKLREANFHLALASCLLALLLALPLFDFGAISARNQLARLESGAVGAEDFDYNALRWDFGDAGRKGLAALAKGKGRAAELAATALAQKERIYSYDGKLKTAGDFNLRVQPDDPALRKLVVAYLVKNPWNCGEACVAVDLGPTSEGRRQVALATGSDVHRIVFNAAGEGTEAVFGVQAKYPYVQPDSKVEIREVPKRYVFVDGKPLGLPLD